MRYELLGCIRVIDENGTTFINAQKIELLFAVLLVRAEQVVGASQLVSEIWNENAPRRADAAIHVYISQLRKFLRRPAAPKPITTRTPGYLLTVAPAEFDLREFEQHVAAGRAHAKSARYEAASASFDAALRLWSGPVLGDLRGEGAIIRGFVTWAEETRLECLEMQIDAQLAMAQHRELIGRLYQLTAEYPLRESFHRQLMLALYRAQRQGDALEVYRSARRVLGDELGIEPCRALKQLHAGILRGDPALDVADPYLVVPESRSPYALAPAHT